MMRSLTWKLTGALLFIVVISIGLMAYLVNRSTTSQFQQYVIQGNAMHTQGIDNSLAAFYSEQQSWNGVQTILPGMLRMDGDRLIVANSNGIVVADTAGSTVGRSADELGLTAYGTAIVVSGRQAGSFYYLAYGSGGMMGGGMMGMMGVSQPAPANINLETQFLSAADRSLWIAGLAAVAAALLVGILLTQWLTRPIRALTKGARQISEGNFNYRVETRSNDEVGVLVQSFNTMAANLTRSEQTRRRMTADIAHELRTPLTIIEGTVDGMLDGVFTCDRENLTTVKEQTVLLTRLIGDLRDLSLAESGQLKLELAQEDIIELIKRKLVQLEVTATEHGLQLTLDVQGIIPQLTIDRMRIEQVIANLLTNAIHHTPHGGRIMVSVKTTMAGQSEQSALIAVSDTGEGIAAEHLPHIYERFYRVSDSRARSEGGTGLGLAIVKHLVQAHGGKVWAESEPGKGSTFFFTLPAVSKA